MTKPRNFIVWVGFKNDLSDCITKPSLLSKSRVADCNLLAVIFYPPLKSQTLLVDSIHWYCKTSIFEIKTCYF